MSDIDAQLRLADFRLRVLNRQPISADEYHLLMQSLRGDRANVVRASAANKRAAKKIMGATERGTGVALDTLFPGMKS